MTDDEAKILLNTPRVSQTIGNKIMRGLMLLASVDPVLNSDTEFCAEHDQIYVGSFSRAVAHMSEDQVLDMHNWGWFYAEESWSHYT